MSDTAPRPETEGPGIDGPQGEDLYGVSREHIAALRDAIEAGETERIEALTLGVHPADLADLIEGLNPSERHAVIETVGARLDPEVLTFLEDPVRDEVIGYMGAADVAAAVTALDTDDAVNVVAGLEEPVQEEILDALGPEDRAALEEALALPEDSAGRLMQRAFVAVPSFWTVGDTIDYLRDQAEKGGGDLPDEFFDLFVVDPAHRPVGVVPLSRLLRTRRPVRLEDLMDTDIDKVPMATDQEDVANLFRHYDLASAAVVDRAGRMVGVITHDDIMDVIFEEAEEDIMLLSGVREDDIYHAVFRTSRARLSWLVVSLMDSLGSALVISHFESTIEAIIAAAILMPIVAALGGNAGTQTMTVAVRALAMRELHLGNAVRHVGKEVLVGFLNGVTMSVLVGTVAGLWFSSVLLGAVIGAALIVNLIVAGLAGVLIPLTLSQMKADPAVASGVFLTTLTDVIGYTVFLGFVTIFLL